MSHRLFTTCPCVGTNCLYVHTAQSQFGATALVALVEIQVLMEVQELLRVVATQAL